MNLAFLSLRLLSAAFAPVRAVFWLLTALSLVALPAPTRADGNEVVLVYSKRIPASLEVAKHYAEARNVPKSHWIELDVDMADTMTRKAFRDQIELPLLKTLAERNLMTFATESVPTKLGTSKLTKYVCTQSSIRYLILCYGIPFRVAPDTTLEEEIPKDYPPLLRRNESSVDNDLALLPIHGNFAYFGAIENRFAYRATDRARLHPTNAVLMVTRLDGPTPELAKGLVDKALVAEKNGLWGRAYFDIRSIRDSAYQLGDTWITNAFRAATVAGFESTIDTKPEVLPITFPMSSIAYYAGWYIGDNSGPFSRPKMEFVPGAFAYHLHSFSAALLRATNGTWTGPLIARGATATMGTVYEPYLHLTPDINVFTVKFLLEGWTFGEAAYSSLAALSWQTVFVGDPLYRPCAKDPIQWANDLEASGSTNLDWAMVRKMNYHIADGKDAEIARRFLLDLPIANDSAVIQEKVGTLFLLKGKIADAIYHYEKALSLKTTPQQRLRLLIETANLQKAFRQQALAYEKFELMLKEYPDQAWALEIRGKQLDIARELNRDTDIQFLEAELKRLAPPPAPAKP